MLSYHNDTNVKILYVSRFAAHRAADEVIQGQGYDNGRGCFVGCTLNAYDHSRFPVELGWPMWLAYLADAIFESIPKSEAAQFGTDLLEAVPVGVDLEPIRFRFLLTVQRRNLARLDGNNAPYAIQVRAAIEQVIEYLQNPDDEKAVWSAEAARSAESAARSAESAARSAESAARSAESAEAARSAESAARSAESARSARSAARSARSAARSAESARSAWSAESAARSAWSEESAARSARSAEFKTQRDDLLAMLRECDAV